MAAWAPRYLRFQARGFSSQAPIFSQGRAGIVRCSPPPEARSHKTPLVFVHGVCHGAWFWRGFQERCAQVGYESYAVNLASLSFGLGSNLSRHAQDVWAALGDNVVESPVIIGHSLGGVVVQEMVQPQYLQGRQVRGMVFMASATRRIYLELLRHWFYVFGTAGLPAFVMAHNFAHLTPDAKAMQNLFFLPSTQRTSLLGDDSIVTMEEYFAKLKKHDVALGALDFCPAKTDFPDVPKLAIVPLQDRAMPPDTQRRLASLAKAELMEVENMGHCLGDEGWETLICAPLIKWLDNHVVSE